MGGHDWTGKAYLAGGKCTDDLGETVQEGLGEPVVRSVDRIDGVRDENPLMTIHPVNPLLSAY